MMLCYTVMTVWTMLFKTVESCSRVLAIHLITQLGCVTLEPAEPLMYRSTWNLKIPAFNPRSNFLCLLPNPNPGKKSQRGTTMYIKTYLGYRWPGGGGRGGNPQSPRDFACFPEGIMLFGTRQTKTCSILRASLDFALDATWLWRMTLSPRVAREGHCTFPGSTEETLMPPGIP